MKTRNYIFLLENLNEEADLLLGVYKHTFVKDCFLINKEASALYFIFDFEQWTHQQRQK